MGSYFTRHIQVFLSTLGDIVRKPITAINTIMIIAVTLLLPALLYIVIQSGEKLSNSWQGRPQVSVFLDQGLNENQARMIFEEIQLHPSVALAEFVSPEAAIEEFRILSNNQSLDEELAFLGENPLPTSIVLMPVDSATNKIQLLALEEQLKKIVGIRDIRLDLEWTERFGAILSVAKRIATLLAALLAFALVLIVGNTIKLLIQQRRDEIEVTKLVGGTNRFIRRPFLYFGTLFGLFGSMVTVLLLFVAAHLIRTPLSKLASVYQSGSFYHQFTLVEALILLATGALLGWLAARWAVAQHLGQIKPK